MRYRIVEALTTSPVFEQFKIHSNRTEINADGFMEYFREMQEPIDISYLLILEPSGSK